MLVVANMQEYYIDIDRVVLREIHKMQGINYRSKVT